MKWTVTWKCEEINYDKIGAVEDHTQRIHIFNNVNGEKVRLRFSNVFSKEALVFDHVTVGTRADGSEEVVQITDVTVAGQKKILVLPGTELISDPMSLHVSAGSWLVVSTYVKDSTMVVSAGSTWTRTVFDITECGEKGDLTESPEIATVDQSEVFPAFYAGFPMAPMMVYGVNGIEVETAEDVKEVALFGDSITHIGNMSSPLIRMLYEKYPGKIAVKNCAISGNRLLRDYPVTEYCPYFYGVTFGEAAIKRFEHAVYGTGHPDYVIVLIGCNDLLYPYAIAATDEPADAEDLKYGYDYLIQTAHSHGSKIAMGQMTPYLSPVTQNFTACLEERRKVNAYITNECAADLVIPFAEAVCDESGESLRPAYDGGDGLHPTAEGGEAMAKAVPLEWFA